MTSAQVDEQLAKAFFYPTAAVQIEPSLTAFTDAGGARVIVVGQAANSKYSFVATSNAGATKFNSPQYATAADCIAAIKTYIGAS